MIIRILCLLFVCCTLSVYAVVNHKQFKRREAAISNSYGVPAVSSPLPIPIYGIPGPVAKYPPPPPDIPPPLPSGPVPHKEYGIPSRQSAHTSSREYGIPFLQYGPPKVNIEYGVPLLKNVPLKNSFASVNNFQNSVKSSLYDQIKSHFGVPKPVYGPPHHIQRPNTLSVQNLYLPPVQNYGPPPLPQIKPLPSPHNGNFGHSLKLSPVYGPPHLGNHGQSHSAPKPSVSYGPPPPSAFGVSSHTAPVYGPPPLEVSPTYVPPAPNSPPIYGPPQRPAPSYGPPPQLPSTSYGVPEPSISSSAQHPIKQVHAAEGHDHSGPTVSCDGWKPIPGPVGANIQGHGSVLNVGYNTGYSSVQNTVSSSDSSHHSGKQQSNTFGLTDEQIVAIALQGDSGSQHHHHQQQQNHQQVAIASDDDLNLIHNSLDNLVQSHSLELSGGGVSDSYGAPPLDSYAPNSIHAIKYETINLNQNDPVGLVPPSGVYGPPSGASYHGPSPIPPPPINIHGGAGLGISYGAQTGNLKPWLHSGSPPKKPILYRPPVPQGLLESIGASVQHLDQYGVPPANQPPPYIPPPSAEIPQQPNIEEHHLASHSEHIPLTQALPSIQEPRFNQAQDCGHGPILSGGGGGGAIEFGNFELGPNQVTSYHNVESQKQQLIETPLNHILTNSYGPPPSGNAGDALSYESKQNNVHVLSQESQSPDKIESNNLIFEQQNFITSENFQQQQQQQQQHQQQQQQHSNIEAVTIPIQGNLGSYQLQFQPADSLGSNPSDQVANHEQILSEGLLQTILSAIEQQPQTVSSSPSNHHQHHHHHIETNAINSRADNNKEANEFLQSPETEKVLSESNETEQQQQQQQQQNK